MVTPLSDPLTQDLMEALRITQLSFYLSQRSEYSGTEGGEIIVKQSRSPLWYAKAQSATLYHKDIIAAQALIDGMSETLGSFYAYNPAQAGPFADPDGSILGTSSVTISAVDTSNKLMTLAGLPAGYTLTIGDLLSFDYGSPSSRALHRLVQSATADGSGNAQVEVRPFIRPGATVGAPVSLIKPSCRMRLVPGTFSQQLVAVTGQISFEAVQVI